MFRLAVVLLLVLSVILAAPAAAVQTRTPKPRASSSRSRAKISPAKANAKKKVSRKRKAAKKLTPAQRARAARLKRAFVASSQLRPMAQQLFELRSPQAYAAVEQYARRHKSESAGSLAWLAVGYAHLLDRQYDAAIPPLQSARPHAGELADYADYFLAQALNGSGQSLTAAAALADFDTHHPDSVLARDATLLRASALVSAGEAQTAIKLLEPLRASGRAEVELAAGKAYAAAGDRGQATAIFIHIYADYPVSAQAAEAGGELRKMSGSDPLMALSDAQKLSRADLLYKARHYNEAAQEMQTLLSLPILTSSSDPQSNAAVRNYTVRYAGALYKANRKPEAMSVIDKVSEQPLDEAGAERLYLLAENARSKDDTETNRKFLQQLATALPQSPWTQEALLSSANMYLLRKDYPLASAAFLQLAAAAPTGRYAGYAHWKGAWLTYRLGDKDGARRLFLEQIADWPAGQEIPAALYWAGRLARQQGRPEEAKAYFAKLVERYQQYYYGFLGTSQLAALSAVTAAPMAELEKVGAPPKAPELIDAPEDDPRVEKSRLLTNAALYDYALREMHAAENPVNAAPQAEPGDATWVPGELARLYLGMNRQDRALQSLKHTLPGYFAYDLDEVPRFYWETLFPRPYWADIKADAAQEGLDPYLVASLIRQESEFNASAVSGANAYGLMQLLPSAAKSMAKDLHIRHWKEAEITDPRMNLRLGTHYFRKLIKKYDGQVEYALAAYNAGDNRVEDWRGAGKYDDIYEFVESIPFTETREYVQAIQRNAMIYAALYKNR